jgi:hypothetical protein
MSAENVNVEDKPEISMTVMEHETFSGILPISWCFNKFGKSLITEEHRVIISAHPLVVTDDCTRYETRTICKPGETVGFISFNRPGKHRIFVYVTEYWPYLKRRDGTGYSTTNLYFYYSSDGSEDPESLCVKAHGVYMSTSIDVDIPKECFASEPPEWEKGWVNFFFRHKSVDQCDYRKRRILAYTVQPIALSVAVVAIFLARFFIVLLLQLFLFKKVNWIAVTENVWSDSYSSFFKDGEIETYIPYIKPPMNIAAIFAILGMICIGVINPILLLSIPTGLAIVGVVHFLAQLEINNRYLRKFLDYLVSEKIGDLPDCEYDKPIRSLKELPRAKKTLKIRFMDLKSKVCRPFAR